MDAEAKREMLLLIIPEGDLRDAFRAITEEHFELVLAGDVEEGLRQLRREGDRISAVLLDVGLAMAEDYGPIKELVRHTRFSAVPVIGASDRRPTPEILACMDHGMFDVYSAGNPPELTARRIRNAIRASDSVTFHEIERILKALPSTIFLKDSSGRYVFSTHTPHHFKVSDDPDWTIQGKTDLEIRKDRANAMNAMAADRRILETGEGTSYVIEEKGADYDEFLQLIKQPVYDSNGRINGIIGLLNDVTEQQLLKRELEKRSQTDLLTGLMNKGATQDLIRQKIGLSLKRGTTAALMMTDVDDFKRINDSFGHAVGDRVLSVIGREIRAGFRGVDIAGRVGGDEFMIFLPDVTAEGALHSAERLRERVSCAFREDSTAGQVSLSVGIALLPAHGRSFDELYHAADNALYHVKNQGKGASRIYTP